MEPKPCPDSFNLTILFLSAVLEAVVMLVLVIALIRHRTRNQKYL
jgi:F0F1-type ATP synthase membrane subunit c/vacuolar-type H+-ATPase subunit K